MIITSCPLRISIVGGSTDHPHFLDKYSTGSVISFPSSLRAYITVHKDVFGVSSINDNYQINYSRKETVSDIRDIKNELVRECFAFLKVDKIYCSMVSDVYSSGSGLASSSAYMQALIKAIHEYRNKNITDFEVCKLANKIEKIFNPLVGQQDFYGSLGGLKRINFFKARDPEIKYLESNIFDFFDMYLLYTGVVRESTSVLETIDIDKSLILLEDVNELEEAISKVDIDSFNTIVSRSWNNKKKTSNLICQNRILIDMDDMLCKDKRVLSHKLCGAGNGGYYLIFTNKNSNIQTDYSMIKKINVSETGLKKINFGD